mgnify:CR=1 FL=1
MKVEAVNVKMNLDENMRTLLAEVKQDAAEVGKRCQDSLDNEFFTFSKSVAVYAASTQRKELEDARKRENFTIRLLNTRDFFRISPGLFDYVFKGIVMRRKAVEVLGAALFDLTMDKLFGWWDDVNKASLEKDRKASIEAMKKKMETEFFESQMKQFKDKTVTQLKNLSRAVTETANVERDAASALRTAKRNFEYWDRRIATHPPGTPQSAVRKWEQQMEQSFQAAIELLEKRTEAEGAQRAARKAAASVEAVRSNLTKLAGAGDDAMRIWQDSFAPGSSGEAIWKQFRDECQQELNEMARLYRTEVDSWVAEIAHMPVELQNKALARLEQARSIEQKFTEIIAFDTLIIDTGKNLSSMGVQEIESQAEQLKAIGEEQDQETRKNSGFFYGAWCWIWDGLSAVVSFFGSIIGGVVSTIKSMLPDWVVTAVNAVFLILGVYVALVNWWILLLVAAYFVILLILMELCKYIATWREYLTSWRDPTYLEGNYREQGQAFMVQYGVPEKHFYGDAQDDTIKKMVFDSDPANMPGAAVQDKAAAKQLQADLTAKVQAETAQTAEEANKSYRGAVLKMCRQALEAPSIFQEDKQAVREQLTAVKGVITTVSSAMKSYEDGLQCTQKSGFVDIMARKADALLEGQEDLSWASIDQWLNIAGTQLTLFVNGISAYVARYYPQAAVTLGVISKTQGILAFASTVRVIFCVFGLIPCVTAFAGDYMAMHGVAFKKMILEEEDAPPPAVVATDVPTKLCMRCH